MMPEVCCFYGIHIYVQHNDHSPPHIHAYYAEHEAQIRLDTREVMEGRLPRRALRLVREWMALHPDELQACWDRAMAHEPPGRIEPLP
jgi:hypothetical protein